MKPVSIVLALKKETARTRVYCVPEGEETSGPPVLDQVYVPKWVLGTPPPQRIRVSIEEAK